MTPKNAIRYEVRALGGSHVLSRHRLFRAACRACVAFLDRDTEAFVYEVPGNRLLACRVGGLDRRGRTLLFTDPETGTEVAVLGRHRR
jgi:hypothetical protein